MLTFSNYNDALLKSRFLLFDRFPGERLADQVERGFPWQPVGLSGPLKSNPPMLGDDDIITPTRANSISGSS
jgi:hypothetical protein